jgi:serine/threonine-protein kinase
MTPAPNIRLPPLERQQLPMECLDENAALALLEGRLAPDAVSVHARHVAGCEECRSLLFELRAASSADPSSSVWLHALGLEATGRMTGPPEPLPAALRLKAGACIAHRYILDQRIGEGGMGVVWSAHHKDSGEPFALKFLKSTDEQRTRRFLREAKIAASLHHPHIVVVHEIFRDGPIPVLVMERLSGESLAARLRREGALDLARVAEIAGPVVDAVAAAHAASVVHRDLKPDNIFLCEGGSNRVKVLDFGIAKRTRPDGRTMTATPDLTHTGELIGTPYYMAPEQLFGEKVVDGRADVWSLGVILYECLAGRRPITGDSFGQVLKSMAVASIPPLQSIAGTVPDEVCELVARMLSRDLRDRPALAEVSDVLARAAADGPRRGRRSTGRRRARQSAIIAVAAVAACITAAAWPRVGSAPPTRADTDTRPPEEAVVALTMEESPTAVPPAPAATTSPQPPRPVTPAIGPAKRRPPETGAPAAASAAEQAKLPGGVERQSPY